MNAESYGPSVRAAGMLGLVIFGVLLVTGRAVDILGSQDRIALFLGGAAVSALFWWTGRIGVVVAYLIFGGLMLRWISMPPGGAGGSDVLAATAEGIDVWFRGGNPYDHFYTATRPPGQPMPYPPGALMLNVPGYLISGLAGVQWTQFAAAAVALGVLAWAAAASAWYAGIGGLALYAGAPNLVIVATDGSNDTLTGSLLLVAIILTARAVARGDPASLLVGGIATAVALSTKQLALPIGVALGAYVVRAVGWRRSLDYLGFAAGLLVAISVPFLVMGPAEYIRTLLSAGTLHDSIYGWNIWAMTQAIGWTPWERNAAVVVTLVVAAVALGAAALVPTRTLAGAVLCGVIATVAIMFSARWSSHAYFALLLPALLIVPSLAQGWRTVWKAREC